MDYLVIGSGLAGLAVSALLAKSGHKITLLELHTTAGGYAHTFEIDHFQYCAQIHYIWGCAPGQTIHSFLQKLELLDEVTFQAFDPSGYDIASLPDGKRIGIPYGFDNLLNHIDQAYPGERAQIKIFLDIIAQLKREISQLPAHIHWWHIISRGWSARTVIRYRNHTLQQVFDDCHLSREAQAILCCQAGDLGAPPNTLSVLAYASLFGGYNEGAYYPTRHFKYFIERLTKVITDQPGCRILYGAKVNKMIVDNDRITSVITADGQAFSADRIICNMDPRKATELIGLDKIPKSYRDSLSYEYSPSSVIMYIGLENIDLRDYGFSNANFWHLTQWDMNAMWQQGMAGNFQQSWFFISSPYLRTPDLTSTPHGCQNLEIGTLCRYDQFAKLYHDDHDAYSRLKEDVSERLLNVIETTFIPTIRDHIRIKTLGTPITNETFCGATRGNCYGSIMTPKNMGLSRLTAISPWKNLFWCNASSGYPGTNGTIYTGINLYTDLTGDDFLPSGNKMPSTDASIEYAIKHAFVNQREPKQNIRQ